MRAADLLPLAAVLQVCVTPPLALWRQGLVAEADLRELRIALALNTALPCTLLSPPWVAALSDAAAPAALPLLRAALRGLPGALQVRLATGAAAGAEAAATDGCLLHPPTARALRAAVLAVPLRRWLKRQTRLRHFEASGAAVDALEATSLSHAIVRQLRDADLDAVASATVGAQHVESVAAQDLLPLLLRKLVLHTSNPPLAFLAEHQGKADRALRSLQDAAELAALPAAHGADADGNARGRAGWAAGVAWLARGQAAQWHAAAAAAVAREALEGRRSAALDAAAVLLASSADRHCGDAGATSGPAALAKAVRLPPLQHMTHR